MLGCICNQSRIFPVKATIPFCHPHHQIQLHLLTEYLGPLAFCGIPPVSPSQCPVCALRPWPSLLRPPTLLTPTGSLHYAPWAQSQGGEHEVRGLWTPQWLSEKVIIQCKRVSKKVTVGHKRDGRLKFRDSHIRIKGSIEIKGWLPGVLELWSHVLKEMWQEGRGRKTRACRKHRVNPPLSITSHPDPKPQTCNLAPLQDSQGVSNTRIYYGACLVWIFYMDVNFSRLIIIPCLLCSELYNFKRVFSFYSSNLVW